MCIIIYIYIILICGDSHVNLCLRISLVVIIVVTGCLLVVTRLSLSIWYRPMAMTILHLDSHCSGCGKGSRSVLSFAADVAREVGSVLS